MLSSFTIWEFNNTNSAQNLGSHKPESDDRFQQDNHIKRQTRTHTHTQENSSAFSRNT